MHVLLVLSSETISLGVYLRGTFKYLTAAVQVVIICQTLLLVVELRNLGLKLLRLVSFIKGWPQNIGGRLLP